MPEVVANRPKRRKSGGRQKGTPNRVTMDVRQALRDLADANAGRVQDWLDRVAENEPAQAISLWLALLRFVTPTLAAAAIADFTPPARTSDRLAKLTDAELLAIITGSGKSPLEHERSAPALPKRLEPPAPEDELLR